VKILNDKHTKNYFILSVIFWEKSNISGDKSRKKKERKEKNRKKRFQSGM